MGGACQYSRRDLRLRRRGAYGIHRASGPRCQGLCRKAASHRENDSLHFVRRSAPSKCVRCASLRSGGRRLAVRKTIEYQIGALTRTPFPASRDFPSRGNERYEEKNRGVICFMYYSSISPFGGWRHHLARWEACHWIRGSRGSPMNPVPLPPPLSSVGRQKESALMGRLGALLRPTWRSYAGPPQGTIKLRYAVSCL